MLIEYTATRAIKTGHSASTVYNFTLDAAPYSPKVQTVGKTQTSLNGTRVHVIQYTEVIHNISTDYVSDSTTPDIDDLQEFLNSVRQGETFTIDGANFTLNDIKNPYTETPHGPVYKSYQFVARAE